MTTQAAPIVNRAYYEWYNRNERMRMRYPSDLAIGFVANNLRQPGRVLDLGCGSGRHVIMAAEFGHEAHGVDLAQAGLDYCAEVAASRGLSVHLRQAGMADTGYPDGHFDAVICYSAINGNTLDEQRAVVAEIWRVLAPDGCVMANFYGPDDGVARRGRAHGREIAPRTYVIPGKAAHPGDADPPDYLAHISTPAEIAELLGDFAEVRQFEQRLPYGNSSLAPAPSPMHLLFALARKGAS